MDMFYVVFGFILSIIIIGIIALIIGSNVYNVNPSNPNVAGRMS